MRYALVTASGTVNNVILAPDLATAQAVAPEGQSAVDIGNTPAGPSWVRDGDTFTPASERFLTGQAPPAFFADGASTATVVYRDTYPNAPQEVTFTVNGAATTVALTEGNAFLDVTTAQPGTVTVTVDALQGEQVVFTAVAP